MSAGERLVRFFAGRGRTRALAEAETNPARWLTEQNDFRGSAIRSNIVVMRDDENRLVNPDGVWVNGVRVVPAVPGIDPEEAWSPDA